MPDVSVSFRRDAAVPALPFVAPFLLAAFLAIGGYRRCVRRRLGGMTGRPTPGSGQDVAR